MKQNRELIVHFSRKIIARRMEKNMSRAELAELCECHNHTIARLECMKHEPSLDLALKIAKVLDISLDAMVDLVLKDH